MTADTSSWIDTVRGDETGLVIPAHPQALLDMGVDFLTRGFQAFGALEADNRVTRLSARACPGGSTGQKLLLDVEYLHPGAHLHQNLFVKFSRDFTDLVRDTRGKYEMQTEIRLAELSRLDAFPIAVPRPYFADYQATSKTGLLITQCIPFGEGEVEPHYPKCMDHRLESPEAYYHTIVTNLARLSGTHRAGLLSPQVEALFPYDREASIAATRIGRDSSELARDIVALKSFVLEHPRLVPTHLRSPMFLSRFARQALRFHAHQDAIARFLQSDPQFVAMCHWNANIDNAWFWRDPSGELKCGLLDWGHAGQMNVAFALWGSISAAHQDVWQIHLDSLIERFMTVLHESGGPLLKREALRLHLLSYVGLMGLGYFLQSPDRILRQFPTIADASGPRDPAFGQHDSARNQLHILTMFLDLWSRNDFDRVIDDVLRSQADPRPERPDTEVLNHAKH
ncbi:hypothetical protein HNO88_002065 [Novosphingobium chloroacetimidivorans]|uniref:Aminoglycoside phosphotransferase domain-containing protein n=1 Tax=Novosphingobium chloroacetimidivorans TaxID=1428314 RepID=A0A7W7NWT2_9SPHN|nr:hypothetical protein [Novosphingobium chloroacetimidivorans]MBB4858739.1 hypothetical protein [Novosphingobium chloroacetimidivorans]